MRKPMIVLVVLVILAATGFATLYFSTDRFKQFGAAPDDRRLVELMKSPQHSGTEFVNPHGVKLSFTFSQYATMFREFFFGEDRSPGIEIPVSKLTKSDIGVVPDSTLSLTWMCHSTALIEIDGFRILTDPVWSERVSPSSLYGPIRFHEMPMALSELPSIDVVIISHDHYDHLDRATVIELADRGVIFVTALGVGSHLESWNIERSQIIELDWWQEYSLEDSIRLVCTPSQHFSGRGLFQLRNRTLWSTWVIIGPCHRLFFCGDTGEIPEFREIGDKFGPFDLTLMKIGAYSDMWPDIHLTPEQSINLHEQLRGRVFVPIHWGSFDLALHPWAEPVERLVAQAEQSPVTMAIPYSGQRLSIDSPPPVTPWWRDSITSSESYRN